MRTNWVILFLLSIGFLIGVVPFSIYIITMDIKVRDTVQIVHVCDERGVCCYERTADRGFSCVATVIKVVVLPGDVQDSRSQGDKPTGGEIDGRALEERVFRNIGGTVVPNR